jgi:protein gp37
MKENRSTGIEWTEHTWNPFVGCNVHSDGCKNCYAMRQAGRMGPDGFNLETYRGVTEKVNGKWVWTGRINEGSAATWNKPAKIGPPSMIFVNSMSDFWHENAKDDWRLRALSIMESVDRHTYQVLTKRPDNILGFAKRTGLSDFPPGSFWFPPNVWIGTTVENRKAIQRIDTLRTIPAHVRFLSIEPLIGPIGEIDLTGIHWVITGGESGPGARRCDAGWVREIRDQCVAAGVPLFHKQWGKPENNPIFQKTPPGKKPSEWVSIVDPVGKGGSLLDGVAWKQWPARELELMP